MQRNACIHISMHLCASAICIYASTYVITGLVSFLCRAEHISCTCKKQTAKNCSNSTQLTPTSSTAQGGGGSFKNRKPIGETGCCESGMAERSHWWTERWLRSPLFFSLFLWLSTYLPIYLLCIYLSIYRSIYLSISLSLSFSFICLSV